MASFSSSAPRPAPSIVYYQPYPDAGPDSSAGEGSEGEGPPPQEAVQKQREDNLLRRARSSIGTVLNGFRGILTPLDGAAQRKSLLGE